jgi:hypothetical protein
MMGYGRMVRKLVIENSNFDSSLSARTMAVLFYFLKTFPPFFERQICESEGSDCIYKGKLR